MKWKVQQFLLLTINNLDTSGVTVSFWTFWEPQLKCQRWLWDIVVNVMKGRYQQRYPLLQFSFCQLLCKSFISSLLLVQYIQYRSSPPCNVFIHNSRYFSCWVLVKKKKCSHLIKPVLFIIRRFSKTLVNYMYIHIFCTFLCIKYYHLITS